MSIRDFILLTDTALRVKKQRGGIKPPKKEKEPEPPVHIAGQIFRTTPRTPPVVPVTPPVTPPVAPVTPPVAPVTPPVVPVTPPITPPVTPPDPGATEALPREINQAELLFMLACYCYITASKIGHEAVNTLNPQLIRLDSISSFARTEEDSKEDAENSEKFAAMAEADFKASTSLTGATTTTIDEVEDPDEAKERAYLAGAVHTP